MEKNWCNYRQKQCIFPVKLHFLQNICFVKSDFSPYQTILFSTYLLRSDSNYNVPALHT